MKLRIYTDDDPILRGPSEPVSEITPEIKALAYSMCRAMAENNGMGLAAPQVGHKLQMLVFDTTFEADDKGMLRILLNPKITKSSTACSTMLESCLSFPGRFVKVKRPSKVTVEYHNIAGKKVTEEFEGLNARVVQHEMDHLQGVLLTDYENQ